MARLKCKHCNYEWEYKGKSLYWACCPMCRANVKIEQQAKLDKEK